MNQEESAEQTVTEELGVTNEARVIAYEIRREIVCCDIYGRVNDNVPEDLRDARFRAARDEIDRHSLCYWGEGSARLAEEIGLSRKRAMVRARDRRIAVIAEILTKGVGARGVAANALAEHILDELEVHDNSLMAAHELTNMDLYPDREGIPNRDEIKRERVTESPQRVPRAREIVENESDDDDERCELCQDGSPSPSYRCYIHRHLDCEPDGPEAGCKCTCHERKVADAADS